MAERITRKLDAMELAGSQPPSGKKDQTNRTIDLATDNLDKLLGQITIVTDPLYQRMQSVARAWQENDTSPSRRWFLFPRQKRAQWTTGDQQTNEFDLRYYNRDGDISPDSLTYVRKLYVMKDPPMISVKAASDERGLRKVDLLFENFRPEDIDGLSQEQPDLMLFARPHALPYWVQGDTFLRAAGLISFDFDHLTLQTGWNLQGQNYLQGHGTNYDFDPKTNQFKRRKPLELNMVQMLNEGKLKVANHVTTDEFIAGLTSTLFFIPTK